MLEFQTRLFRLGRRPLGSLLNLFKNISQPFDTKSFEPKLTKMRLYAIDEAIQ